jgi:hypothetical protein
MLNPKITKDSNGVYWLEYSAEPTAEGYAYTTPNGASRTFDPTKTKVKLGAGLAEPVLATVAALDIVPRPSEAAQYPPVVDPPDPPDPPNGSTPDPVIPPSPYTVPVGAKSVSTTAELLAALSAGTVDIVLEDGTYDHTTYFAIVNKRLYARNLGKAILKVGISAGGNSTLATSPKLQGLVIDTVKAKCFNNAAIYPWGAGAKGFTMLDTVVKGNKSVAYGVNNYAPQDSVYERLEFYDFTDVGLRTSTNHIDATTIKRIRDIYVNGVTRVPVNSSNGTAEAGLFIGHKVIEHVRRVKVRNVSWSGIEPVNACYDTEFSDLDIDMAGIPTGTRVGVYLEHYSWGSKFLKFLVVGCKTGFNCEWDSGSGPAAKNVLFAYGEIVGGKAGINLDDGSGPGNAIDHVSFKGQTWAAVGAYKNKPNPVITNCTYQLPPGAVQFSTNHI